MFQYIAFSWDSRNAQCCAAAHRLSSPLSASERWQAALLAPGLHVFTAGGRQGVNGSLVLHPHRGVVVGKLFRRNALATATDIELDPDECDRIVRTQGRTLVDEFWGRYVALLPAPDGGTLVLRDPSGALPCHRLCHDGVWITFSWLEGLLEAAPSVPPPRVDWEGVAAHLLLGSLGGSGTALEGVLHVPSGQLVHDRTQTSRSSTLWNAAGIASRPPDEPFETAAQRLRHTVRFCVRSWSACHEDIILRLSGGLDSAILLSCLDSHAIPARVTCLNYHAPGSDSDERPHARCVADHMGAPLIEKAGDTGYPLECVLDLAPTPTPESYIGRMGIANMDAQMAVALGASAVFTGAGGDQLFFQHRCAHPGADYLRTRGLDAGLPGAILDAARLGHVSVWAAALHAVARSLRRRDDGRGALCRPALVHDALDLSRPDRHAHPCMASAHDLPIGKHEQLQHLLAPIGCYDPWLRDAAPELVHPLLSQPLIELCLALPTWLLTRGGRGRALARHAFADDLPSQIVTRRSKGGMDDYLAAILHRNLAFARELLLDGQLVCRRLVDRDRLAIALSGQPSTLATHVGEIHGLVALEAWLNRCTSLQQTHGRA